MRKLFLHMMVSLDGYIEGPNQELDWHFVDNEFEEYSNNMLRSIDGILIGRKVYQVFVDYWPNALENPAGASDPSDPSLYLETARLLNDLPKYVVSTTLKEPGWNNTRIIRENIKDEILKVKKEASRDIALFGGSALISSLIERNLIDEYRLIVNPVLLGGGTPLFRNGIERMHLRLINKQEFRSGAVLLVYKPDNGNS